MSNPAPLSDADLQTYADRQVSAARAAEIEAALARDPEAAARVAAIRAHNAALAQALDPWLAEPVPERLLRAATPPAESRMARWLPRAFALAATLLLGIALGWFGRDGLLERQGVPTTFAREAAYAHAIYASDQGRPVELGAQDESRLVRWLTRRLGMQVTAPDLNAVGFALVGGRLLAGNEKPTGLLMYENADKQRLTLQWRKVDPGSNETAFRYAFENGVGIFYWVDEYCTYALSGPVDRSQLLAVARVVYGQMAAAEARPLAR